MSLRARPPLSRLQRNIRSTTNTLNTLRRQASENFLLLDVLAVQYTPQFVVSFSRKDIEGFDHEVPNLRKANKVGRQSRSAVLFRALPHYRSRPMGWRGI